MSASRPPTLARVLALTAATAFVLGMSGIAAADATSSATAPARSTSTPNKKHTRSSAAEHQRRLNEHVNKLTERLKLTDDQATKVRSILQARMTQAAELRAKYKGDASTPEARAAFQQARKDLHADTDAKLAEVLTADQLTEYRKIRAEHMKRMGAKEGSKEQEEKEKEGGQ